MRYMLLIYTDPAADAAQPPEAGEALMGEYTTFTQKIVASGELISGEPLQGIETATSVRVRDGRTSTTDGPFAETKEVLGGYYLVDVADLDRATELAAQIPGARTGTVEVRPIWEFPAQ
jgi:hypothetical protein